MQIRIVTTWQPQSPALSSCLTLENSHEECFVSVDQPQCLVALPEAASASTAAAPIPPKLAEAKLEFEAEHVGQCRIGLSTVTVLDAHIDWVDFRVFVPGMSAPCSKDVPAPHEADAKNYLLKSGATVNIYLSDDAGQQFAVGPSVLIDHQGWKVFQFNGTSRFMLGPYATHAPTTLAPTTTATPTRAPTRSRSLTRTHVSTHAHIHARPLHCPAPSCMCARAAPADAHARACASPLLSSCGWRYAASKQRRE